MSFNTEALFSEFFPLAQEIVVFYLLKLKMKVAINRLGYIMMITS